MLFILNRDEEVVAIFNNNDSPDSCPYYDDLLRENLSYGTSTYQFSVPKHHNSKMIEEGGYVVRKDLDGKTMMFTIMEIEETHSDTGEIFVFGENTGMEIINAILRPTTYHSVTATEMLTDVLQDTRWEVGQVDNFGTRTFNFEDYENKLLRLEEIAREFDGEISFSVEIANGKIVKRLVNLVYRQGTETKKRFTYSKDISSITRKVNMNSVVTALIGVGKGENEEYLSFESEVWSKDKGDPANKPLNQDWIGDDEALQRYGIKGNHIFGVYEYSTNSSSELLNRTWTRLQQLKEPHIEYELDVALLEILAGYEHEKVRIGDTVHVTDTTFSPALYLEARVKELETSFTDPTKNKATLSNFKLIESNITKEMREIQKKLLKKEATWDSILENVIFKDPLPPIDPPIGGLWLDTDSVPNTIYRYDGADWIPASATIPSDIGAFGFESGQSLEDSIDELENNLVETNKSLAKVSSDLLKTNSNITAKFQATGGINLIHNSIGYSLDFWKIFGTVNTEQNLELEQLGFGSAFVTDVGQSGYLEQTFNTSKSNTYTISFYLKKTSNKLVDDYAGIELYLNNEKVVFLGKDNGTGVTEGYERYEYTFETEYSEATIRIVFGNNAKANLTGLMVNEGDVALGWSMAQGEMVNTNIVFNLNGIRVVNNATRGYTRISSEEFSGYAETLNENNEPIMEKVFTLNGDTTIVKKIKSESEINMPPIKIVPIQSLEYNGWAFIPSE